MWAKYLQSWAWSEPFWSLLQSGCPFWSPLDPLDVLWPLGVHLGDVGEIPPKLGLGLSDEVPYFTIFSLLLPSV
jgi:hypothetical protein